MLHVSVAGIAVQPSLRLQKSQHKVRKNNVRSEMHD